jgi:hypothetical protein
MVVPTAFVAWSVSAALAGRPGQVLGLAAGAVAGLAVYGGVQLALRSPDLASFRPASSGAA